MKLVLTVVITIVLTAAVVIVLGIFSGMGIFKHDAAATKVQLDPPRRGTVIEAVRAPGEVEPKTQVDIRSRISAKITKIPYKEGDRVTAGDPDADPPVEPSVLLQLDDRDLNAEYNSAEAGFEASRAQVTVAGNDIERQKAVIDGIQVSLEQARRELNRYTVLLEKSDISQAEFEVAQAHADELKTQLTGAERSLENAELGLQIAQHNLTAAEARKRNALDSLSYTTITSPINGVVIRVNSEVGEMATGSLYNPGNIILQVADLSEMILKAEVDEADIARVENGQNAKITIQAWQDRVFSGTVFSTALSTQVSSTQTKFFEVKILIDKGDVRLPSGLTADVAIEVYRHEDVLKVPSQAVLRRKVDEIPFKIRNENSAVQAKKTFTPVVYRFIEGEAVVTPVEIGKSDATHTIITSGITEEDTVVTGPYNELEKMKHKQKIVSEAEAEDDKNGKNGETDGRKDQDPEGAPPGKENKKTT